MGDIPADTGTVVLHRVSAMSSGGVDSVRVGPGGTFELAIPPRSDPGEVLFATIRRQGVLYFGPPIAAAPESQFYAIQAYPALPSGSSTPVELRARSVFATRIDSAGWEVAELFEIHNGHGATLVAEGNEVVWSHALPVNAVDADVGASEMGSVAPSLRSGRLAVSEPLPPGQSVFFARYAVPAIDFDIPLEAPTGSMELLVREPADEVAVAGLLAGDVVEVDGARYLRFAGRDVAPSVVTVTTGSPRARTAPAVWVAVFVALVLAGVGAALAARPRLGPGRESRREPNPRRRRALADIARLDVERAAGRISEREYGNRRARRLAGLGR